jgi:hypothetical protein
LERLGSSFSFRSAHSPCTKRKVPLRLITISVQPAGFGTRRKCPQVCRYGSSRLPRTGRIALDLACRRRRIVLLTGAQPRAWRRCERDAAFLRLLCELARPAAADIRAPGRLWVRLSIEAPSLVRERSHGLMAHDGVGLQTTAREQQTKIETFPGSVSGLDGRWSISPSRMAVDGHSRPLLACPFGSIVLARGASPEK